MHRVVALAVIGLVGWTAPLLAQGGQTSEARSSEADRRVERYRMGTMERVLENAVEHGAAVTRDRLRTLIPADVLLSEEARARGFRLQGYGIFFDVLVPNLEGTLPWVYRTLSQTDLGLENALETLRAMVEAQGGNADVRQALRRIELEVAPAGTAAAQNAPAAPDPILDNPEEAYRAEVIEALMDAVLTHSHGLALSAGEWLTVGARRDDSPRLGAADSPARTIQISVQADDLRALQSGRITREEARARMSVRVF